MATALDRNEQVALTRELYSEGNIVDAPALNNHRRTFVNHPVPDLANDVVSRVAGQMHGALQAFGELGDCGSFNADFVTGASDGVYRAGGLVFRSGWADVASRQRHRQPGSQCGLTEFAPVHCRFSIHYCY